MDLSFFPDKIRFSLNKCDLKRIFEIRIRKDYPVLLKNNEKKGYLTENGFSLTKKNVVICDENDIKDIINRITEFSVYAHNEKIKKGYLIANDGIRIGLSGECVTDDGKILTIKDISSLNIRIPHEIKNSSDKIFPFILSENEIKSSLIISPPRQGKTTILKDLARKINSINKYSLLIIDERGEFSNVSGENIDLIKFSDKLFALEYGVRSLSPDIVITDELSEENDWFCAEKAVGSGVKIIASCHGKSIFDVINKKGYKDGIFERFFILSPHGKAGVLLNVFDGDKNPL